MTPRRLAYATIAVLVVAALMTSRGIELRFAAAQARFDTRAVRDTLATRFHRGALPCRRYLDAADIPATETASTADALVRGGLTRWMPEALALTWRWSAQDEARHHTLDADEEYAEVVLDALSPVDRFWLQSLGGHRLAELSRTSTETEALLAQRAAAAEARMPVELKATLHEVWAAHPGPLARPAEVGLIDAVARALDASSP